MNKKSKLDIINDSNELLSLLLKNDDIETFEDSLNETKEKILDSAKNSKPIRDSYSNSLLSIGGDDKVENFTEFGMSNSTLNWPLWLALYNDSWVFKRAIDKPAQDEIRCGITIQGDFENKDVIQRKLRSHRTDFIQLLKWGALFGGAIAVLMFDNLTDEDYKNPMNYEKLKQFKTMKMLFYFVL